MEIKEVIENMPVLISMMKPGTVFVPANYNEPKYFMRISLDCEEKPSGGIIGGCGSLTTTVYQYEKRKGGVPTIDLQNNRVLFWYEGAEGIPVKSSELTIVRWEK